MIVTIETTPGMPRCSFDKVIEVLVVCADGISRLYDDAVNDPARPVIGTSYGAQDAPADLKTQAPPTRPANEPPPTLIELTYPEKSRMYVWPDGHRDTFNDVRKIYISPRGTHRLETGDGKKHIVRCGWCSITVDVAGWSF